MKNYQFETTATMKEYNRRKWWIDSGIIPTLVIEAENLPAALKKYQEITNDKHGIMISDNAIRNKSPMYIDRENEDPKQVGYVITGKTEFEDRDKYNWSTQYIDLWVTIHTLGDAFEGVNA